MATKTTKMECYVISNEDQSAFLGVRRVGLTLRTYVRERAVAQSWLKGKEQLWAINRAKPKSLGNPHPS